MKILNTIGGAFAPEGKKILAELGEIDYRIPTRMELVKIIDNYDAALIGLGLSFDREVLDKASKLEVIATATTGLDHLDVVYAKENGIEILSLRGEDAFLNTISGTAELALGLMIDLVRHTPWAFDSVKKYKWNREDFKGITLRGKTLGIIGLGRLGSMMARYGEALGMKVIFADPSKEDTKYRKVSFDDLLRESDIISIHVHLTGSTEGMFNANAFKIMKKGAYLINTSRGKIVLEEALRQALENGQVGGYATDVLAQELLFEAKGFKKHPLVEYAKIHDNCIIVPHIGGMTVDSRIATDIFMAKKLREYFQA